MKNQERGICNNKEFTSP
jgi:hypothetical protein